MSGRTGSVHALGHRFEYTEYGRGDRVVVLLHGLLFHRRMDERLAAALAEHGYRVLCLDQLGHGGSDRPVDPADYSMPRFAEYVLAVLDELGLDQVVLAGRSLGANTTLEVALIAPQRLRGLIAEGPVLEGARTAAMVAFGPFLITSVALAPAMRAIAALTARIPRGDNLIRDMYLDALGGPPRAKSAMLRGLLFTRGAPPPAARATIRVPALVAGYPKDPLHRDSEVRTLLSELPGSRHLRLESMYELHTHPERPLAVILDFLETCWGTPPQPAPQDPSMTGSTS
ncbi:alpha/beta fold hydrolase [Nocardia sp. CDC160]|uniref:alpha/beta fold hydrolase n=1 Tax=Nocardia sp. CDC160 TaxID=3112166 RepID=UPI002DBF654B|nr:alpha/beta hydrolase [Nocardia sp. CDC160]MEC3919375.1 alpha/beta hydrolase [Nocardia sp. CDC160]